MKVISFYNFKGGTGKTNTCTQIAQELASQGYRVLAIDADPQSNLTDNLYKVNLANEKTFMDIFLNDTKAEELVVHCKENLDLIPNDISSIILAEKVYRMENKEKRFGIWGNRNKEFLYNYDYILIDTNCSFDVIAKNIIIASDTVISIVEHGDFASIKGVSLFYSLRKSFLKELGYDEDYVNYHILLNRYKRTNAKLIKLFDATLDNYPNIKDRLLDTIIGESVLVPESDLRKISLDELIKVKKVRNSKVEGQYKTLIKELKEKDVM